jgi:hypothetical protein
LSTRLACGLFALQHDGSRLFKGRQAPRALGGKGELVMEKLLNILDGTIVILLGMLTIGIVTGIQGIL